MLFTIFVLPFILLFAGFAIWLVLAGGFTIIGSFFAAIITIFSKENDTHESHKDN